MPDSESKGGELNLSLRAKSLWAKASKDPDCVKWLPLAIHMSDAAGVARKLWREWLSFSAKQIIIQGISGKNGSDVSNAEDVLVFLAAAHDLGKAIPAFQSKELFGNPEQRMEFVSRVRSSGLEIREDLSDRNRIHHSLASEKILEMNGFDRSLAVVLGGHHGRPPSHFDIEKMIIAYENNTGFKDKKWLSVQNELLDYAILISGNNRSVISNTILSVAAQFILTGLVVMSDWIASDETKFPLVEINYSVPCGMSEYRVESAWDNLNLPKRWEPGVDWKKYCLYNERFGYEPRPFQKAMEDVASSVSGPTIMIAEAPMGEGKTEAALVASEILAERFGCGGLFFALPTQATADGLFPRVKGWINKASLYDDVHSIFLAHGKSAYNAEYRELYPMRMNLDNEGVSKDRVTAHEWLRGRKKGILSDFIIGTVDQVLMGGLKQKHLCMRHLGLANKVVIIDECHAYDAYMGSYLSKVITWLGEYKVPVIVLSATLPPARRKELIEAYLGNRNKVHSGTQESMPQWVSDLSYPLITYTENGVIKQKSSEPSERSLSVNIMRVTEESVMDKIDDLSLGGGYIGIIVNTVKRAQKFSEMLENRYPGSVHLLHSRYISIDRTHKEKEIMELLKEKRQHPPHREFIVGTQVIEQSLDIDFDLMVSDLCPMDLLIQRIGRLHRHSDNVRPERLKQPTCMIMGAEGPEFEEGSEYIYGKFHLMNSRQLLPEVLHLPEDIPQLVHSAYDPKGITMPDELADSYRDASLKANVEMEKKKARAETFQIKGPRDGIIRGTSRNIVGWLDNDVADDSNGKRAEAAVRDTNGSLEVLLIQKRTDGRYYVLPWLDEFGGMEIPFDSVPDNRLAFAVAGCRIALPSKFSSF